MTHNEILELLTTDADYVIAATVRNNPKHVRKRYSLIMGRRPPADHALISQLQAMRLKGQGNVVLDILSVPWIDHGEALDNAVLALRSEAEARLNDVTMGVGVPMKSMITMEGPDNTGIPSSGTTQGSNDGDGTDFWASLPGILTGLGALAGAFTGHVPGAAGSSPSTPPPPPPKPKTNWGKVVLVGLLAAGAIVATVFLIRKLKK